MNFRRQAPDSGPGFQMAPMIDVVFLLLLFWMVTSIYAQWERKIDLKVPTAETGAQQIKQGQELIINIDSAGIISINNNELTLEALESVLDKIAGQQKGHPVIIRADRVTHFQAVISVLDICRKTGVYNISFANLAAGDTPPEPDEAQP
jgi:biopolymer transport protein ExbD